MTLDRRRAWLALAVVLAVATGLRLYHLDHESVWLDEAFSVEIARTSLANIVFETGHDVHPPLHYFLLYFWDAVLGGTAWAARLLSVVFSVATIAATYLVAARLRSRQVGLVAAVLLACSVFQIEFAQEARMYALLALLSTLSTYAFIRLIDDASPRVFAGYVLATALLVYTHAYAAFVIAGQAASLALHAAGRRGTTTAAATRWMLALIGVFAAFLPWLAIFTWQFTSVQHGFWIPEPEWSGWLGPLVTYAGSRTALSLFGPLAIAGAIHLSVATPAPPDNPRSPMVFIGPWLLAPVLLPLALSRVSTPIFLAKYTVAASVPFAILVADAIALVPLTLLRTALLALVVAMTLPPLRTYYTTTRKDNWRAVPVVESQARAGDLLLFYPYFHQIPFDFYRRRDDLVERAVPLFAPPPPPDGWRNVMDRAIGPHRRVWLVTLQGDPTRGAVVDQFRQRLTERSHLTLQHIDVYFFERP